MEHFQIELKSKEVADSMTVNCLDDKLVGSGDELCSRSRKISMEN